MIKTINYSGGILVGKSKKTATEQVRSNLWAILKTLFDGDDYTDLYNVADDVGIERESARQAYKYGKGTEVMLVLILTFFGIKPSQIKNQVPKIRKMFDGSGKLSVIEELIEETRTRLSDNEFIAELRTIIARDEIRTELGLKKRAGRPRKS